jgi:hypothetical protein
MKKKKTEEAAESEKKTTDKATDTLKEEIKKAPTGSSG